jgi:drug/metabolite transporter (DMT)-like permease
MVVGGPILTVALFSRVFLVERLGASGKVGILCGFAAVILLTVG